MKAIIPVRTEPIATIPMVSPALRPLAKLLLPMEYDDAFTPAATLVVLVSKIEIFDLDGRARTRMQRKTQCYNCGHVEELAQPAACQSLRNSCKVVRFRNVHAIPVVLLTSLFVHLLKFRSSSPSCLTVQDVNVFGRCGRCPRNETFTIFEDGSEEKSDVK